MRLTGRWGSALYMPGTWNVAPLREWTVEFWARPADDSRYQHIFCAGRRFDHKVIITNRGRRNTWEVEVVSYGYTRVT